MDITGSYYMVAWALIQIQHYNQLNVIIWLSTTTSQARFLLLSKSEQNKIAVKNEELKKVDCYIPGRGLKQY